MPPAGTVLAAVALACAGGASVPLVRLDPIAAAPPGGGDLAPVRFMAGCWRSSAAAGAALIEERWTPPEGGLMLGTTRYLRDGRVVFFEFSTLSVQDGTLVLNPYPGGDRSPAAFRLTRSGGGAAVFEAPEHDFPKRIIYERLAGGGLRARADGGEGDPEPQVWDMAPTPCG